MAKQSRPGKVLWSVFLTKEEWARLKTICEARGQSKADFLRGAMEVPGAIPILNTRPLSGACLTLHKAKLAREKRAARSRKRKV